MRRFVIVALLVLLPMLAFGEECKSFIEATHVDGVVCRDKCLANEKIVQQVEILDGEYKGTQVCLRCYKKGVKDSKGRPVPSGKEACSKMK